MIEKWLTWVNNRFRNFDENIIGKPAKWVNPSWNSNLPKLVVPISILLGLYELIDTAEFASAFQSSNTRVYFYATLVALATVFVYWVVLLVLLRGTFVNHTANACLSIISSIIILKAISKFGFFVLIEADWDIIWANRVTLAIGADLTYGVTQDDVPNETWRLWPPVFMVSLIIGTSYATTVRHSKQFLIPFTILSLLSLFFVWNPNHVNYEPQTSLILLTLALICTYVSFGLTYRYCQNVEEYLVNRVKSWIGIASILTFFLTIIFMDPPEKIVELGIMDEGVPPQAWGGLFVNLLLSVAACVIGFFISIILAFGRRSDLPFFKFPSVAIIELVRSGPLVAWLFIAFFLIPDIIRPIYEADAVIRTILIISLFGGCYMAEVLRGGLQAVPYGQIEAATALGLTPIQTKLYVELPSAIRTTLPAMVGIFIGLWKDTTLVYLLGVLDFFALAKILANTDREFLGNYREPLIFAGFIFWAVAFYMSRISKGIEAKLGLGNEGGGEAT